MKKILFMVLMLLTVFTFVACGGITTGNTTNPTTQAPTTTEKTTIVDPDSPKDLYPLFSI